MPKGVPNKRYTPKFKKRVVEPVIEEGLSYQKAAKVYEVGGHDRIQSWERIYLTKVPDGLAIERRGRRSTDRPKQLSQKVDENLLAEVQRLRTETAYLKKLASLSFGGRTTPAQKNAGSSKAEAKLFTGYSSFHRSTAPCDLLLPSETNDKA